MRQIQNFEALAVDDLRRDALAIAEAGYEAINVGAVISGKVQVVGNELHIDGKIYPLDGRRVFFVGVGKCAIAGGRAIEAVLGDFLTGGVALDVSAADAGGISKIEMYIGTHPLPTDVNERATERIIEFLSGLRNNDLVIMLVSGGGSTLLCLHDSPMTCMDESILFETLTARGAPIRDINTVRKHTSKARGGALAAAAYPAEVLSLIVSDVPGNDLSVIASGPTILDASTAADAQAVLERYGMASPAGIILVETPKDPKFFERITNVLILSNKDALVAMKKEAEYRGYRAVIVDDHFIGESLEVGRTLVEKLHDSAPKTALLYAGESTVTLSSTSLGAGGRNQEMALAVLEYLNHDELILPFASDGHDNTDSRHKAAWHSYSHTGSGHLTATGNCYSHTGHRF